MILLQMHGRKPPTSCVLALTHAYKAISASVLRLRYFIHGLRAILTYPPSVQDKCGTTLHGRKDLPDNQMLDSGPEVRV